MLAHLPQALIAVHGRGAQHAEGVVVGHLPRLHQDELGAVHHLALFQQQGGVDQRLPQGLLVPGAGLGNQQQRRQISRSTRVGAVEVNARGRGLFSKASLRVACKGQHRTGHHGRRTLHQAEQRVVGLVNPTQEHLGCDSGHVMHQISAFVKHQSAARPSRALRRHQPIWQISGGGINQ